LHRMLHTGSQVGYELAHRSGFHTG
jgi:hypothetical protein